MSTDPPAAAIDGTTEELRAELADARRALDEFFHVLPVAMIEVRLTDLRITVMNRLARIVLGYDPDTMPEDLSVQDIVTPEEFQRLVAVTVDIVTRGTQPDGTYRRTGAQEIYDSTGRRRDGSTFPVEFQSMFVLNADQQPVASRIIFRDVSERKAIEAERERLVVELQEALANVRQLEGLLPICAWCKKVRDDGGYWNEIEAYVRHHSGAEFSHGICPDCARRFERDDARDR